jgi:hypothetical protein
MVHSIFRQTPFCRQDLTLHINVKQIFVLIKVFTDFDSLENINVIYWTFSYHY